MYVYEQSTGLISREDNGRIVFSAFGYSGFGLAKNRPAAQTIPNNGPIPQGKWQIVELIESTTEHGPYVLRLEPEAGTDTFGRDGFLIHGDSIDHPGTASEGCIILPRFVRETIWLSGDRELEVIA